MTTKIEYDKAAAHRDAWIKAEAAKLAQSIEARTMASLVKPDLEAKVREWIAEEVRQEVRREVAAYCKDMLNVHVPPPSPSRCEDEEFIHMLPDEKIDADLDYVPHILSPPRLERQ